MLFENQGGSLYTLDEFTFVARSISSMEIDGDDVYVGIGS